MINYYFALLLLTLGIVSLFVRKGFQMKFFSMLVLLNAIILIISLFSASVVSSSGPSFSFLVLITLNIFLAFGLVIFASNLKRKGDNSF